MTDSTPGQAALRAALRARLADAARALIGAAVRHLLTAIGTVLVTRGLIDQGSVDGIVPMAVEVVVGFVLALIGTGWGQLRAYASHTRWARALAVLRAGDTSSAADTSNPGAHT